MNKKILFLILALPILVLAAGCAPECADEDYASFTILPDSPPHGELVNYQEGITFEWHHNESCKPAGYRVTLTDLISGQIVHIGRDNSDTIAYSAPHLDFRANREYEWTVAPVSEGIQIIGKKSDPRRFRTDGLCQAHELVPPILQLPGDESWKSFDAGPNNARLEWLYPGECFPEFYHYQLASDPNFSNIITSGITEFSDYYSQYYPDPNASWIKSPYTYQRVTIPECARIYWRVEARRGNDSGGYSEIFRFTNAADFSCWQNQASIDAALIKGYVFEDYCSSTVPYVPEGVGIAPPCIFGEPYGVHANGVRARVSLENEMTGEMDPAEIGIPGVVVDLGAGPCPSTGLDQFTTVENGNYYFMVQSPGEYCVSIDKAKNPDLDHGIWTLPLTDQDITQATILFNPGDDLVFQNFGWDQNDFLNIDFFVELVSFCRAGDSPDHRAVAEVPSGLTIPIFARNEESTWFATFVNGQRCFISIASGEPAEDPKDLLIFPEQPDPVPADTEAQPKQCSAYKSVDSCEDHGCDWVWSTAGPGFCKNP